MLFELEKKQTLEIFTSKNERGHQKKATQYKARPINSDRLTTDVQRGETRGDFSIMHEKL